MVQDVLLNTPTDTIGIITGQVSGISEYFKLQQKGRGYLLQPLFI